MGETYLFGWSFGVGGGGVRVGSSVESIKIKPNCGREGRGRGEEGGGWRRRWVEGGKGGRGGYNLGYSSLTMLQENF